MRASCTFVWVVVCALVTSFGANSEQCRDSELSEILHETITVRSEIETSLARLNQEGSKSGSDGDVDLLLLREFDSIQADALYSELHKHSVIIDRYLVADKESFDAFISDFQEAWDRFPGAPIVNKKALKGRDYFVNFVKQWSEGGRFVSACEQRQIEMLMSSGFGQNLRRACANYSVESVDPDDSRPACRLRFSRFARLDGATKFEIRESFLTTIKLPSIDVEEYKVRQRFKLFINDSHILNFYGRRFFTSKLFRVLRDEL